MDHIPHDKSLDSTLALLKEGFPFILNRVNRYKSDIFSTRLMGEKTICLHGQEAAKVFYDNALFQRKGAVSRRIQTTLMGRNGVQTMDDTAHRHRKAMFMSLMTPESIRLLMDQVTYYWKAYLEKWEKMESVVLFDDVQEILCLAACAWAGVPLKPTEVRKRARDFGAMIDAFGGAGPRHWRGKQARKRAERWIVLFIGQVRHHWLKPPGGTAAHVISWHRELNGKLLDIDIAAVELINVLRPIVAIATYITFEALALHEHPEYLQKLRSGEPDLPEMFAQEVRRLYPFGPFLGARVRSRFEWGGYHFRRGTLVLLDMYGTNHDPRVWEQPDAFYPERFRQWDGSPFNFIPQGGGDHDTGHRCAGERITIETMKLALHILANCISYQVPEQDLSYSLVRMPTLPKSRFVISHVTRTGSPSAGKAPGVTGCPFHHG